MAREEKGNAGNGAEKRYFYKLCPRCGAKSHLDNMYCVKCGRLTEAPGTRPTVYVTETDPEVKRSNLDHPAGCPSCGLECRYCFSFSAKEPHFKANCRYCEGTRKACCAKARKLPVTADEGLYGEEIGKCRSHCGEASGIINGRPDREAG
jgi:ribosomal protein L40E